MFLYFYSKINPNSKMKISLVVLFAVLATLMQLQVTVSAAENSSSSTLAQSSNSSTLIRRKRWSWFWDDAVPSVSIVLNDAVTKIQFGVETIMDGAKEAYNTGKNALFGTISYDKGEATDVVTDVSNACREALALTDTRSPEDDVDFNLEIIDTYINQNFEDDNLLKVNLEEKHPELTDVVMFSKKGFECNEEFCT